MKKRFKFLMFGAATLAMAGCASRRQAAQGPPFAPPPPPRPIYTSQPPPGAIIVQPGQTPPGGFPTAPPGGFAPPPPPPGAGGFPTAPPPGTGGFPTAPPPGPSSQAPVPPPPTSSGIPNEVRDRVGFRWEPGAPPAQAQAASPPSVLLLPPTPEPGSTRKDEPRREPYPPATPPKDAPISSLPVGIAGFDRARENNATGQRPTLEGLDWLQKSNYKTIVFLHLPGEATDADRQQIEKRGMTFVPIEINPRDLNRESVERFLRVQIDHRSDKLFVYDFDGSVAGAMWYLSFRIIDQDNDDIARIKAGSLGQSENRDSARDAWQAVRKYLEQKS